MPLCRRISMPPTGSLSRRLRSPAKAPAGRTEYGTAGFIMLVTGRTQLCSLKTVNPLEASNVLWALKSAHARQGTCGDEDGAHNDLYMRSTLRPLEVADQRYRARAPTRENPETHPSQTSIYRNEPLRIGLRWRSAPRVHQYGYGCQVFRPVERADAGSAIGTMTRPSCTAVQDRSRRNVGQPAVPGPHHLRLERGP